MNKLEKAHEILIKAGYKAKMKDGVVSIRGFKVTLKGDTVFIHNHKKEIVGYGLSVFGALSTIFAD